MYDKIMDEFIEYRRPIQNKRLNSFQEVNMLMKAIIPLLKI